MYLHKSDLYLSPFETSNYTLWKTAKKLKQPEQISASIMKQDYYWARSDQEKANTFAEYLVNTRNAREVALSSSREEVAVFDRQEPI